MKSKIWLSSPHMGGNEQVYVQEAFDTNWVAPLGPNVNNFELELAEYLGTGSVAALNSGTSAIHLALILLGVKAGDEVVCQSFTFSASANPIAYLNAIPVFVDSEKSTWNMDPELLETAVLDRISKGKKPKAIILVHLYGMPAQIDEIRTVAKKYDIAIIEDAAEALGSKYDGNACGSFGDIGIFSFNGNKIITTSGGGALVSENRDYIERAKFLATQARDDAPHYQHSTIGYNYRMSNIAAGIGRGQLEVLTERVNQRRKNNSFYHELFKADLDITFQKEPDKRFYSNYWLSAILIGDELGAKYTREDLRLEFEKSNIETRPLWKPMHLQPVFGKYPSYTNGVSENLFENGLCLPSGSNLSVGDKNRIREVVEGIFERS